MEVQSEILSPVLPISRALDDYLTIRGVQKKKYYAKYLVIAKKVWREIFQKTIWQTASVWKPVKKGDPYSYIDVPKGAVRIFSINTKDDCGNLVPLYYNSQLSVIPEPETADCSCDKCNCSDGVCGDVNSMLATTKVIFTINGIDYIEKKWTKYCPNGDIIEYTETPVKKYNDYIGNSGDFNEDYNNDFKIGSDGLANYSIEYITSQKIICKLKTRPCGCPENTEENASALIDYCGCYYNHACAKSKKCHPIFQNVNNNKYGEVKLSECGTKIYFKPSPKFRCSSSDGVTPEHLNVSYQLNGDNCDSEVLIPEYALTAFEAGVDYYSKRFNGQYTPFEKREAKYAYVDEQNELIKYLNPLSLSFISKVQDVKILW